MPAIQNGTARVLNGNQTVRHIWNLVVSGPADFLIGDTVSWTNGTGVIVGLEPAVSRVKLYRTGGVGLPAPGLVLTGTSQGTATITQYGPGTPGKWDLGTIGTNPVYFHRSGSGKAFQVSAINATDQLTLQVAYDDPTESDVGYAISQDYTPNYGIPIVQLGDVDALTILSLALMKIDQLLLATNGGQLANLPTGDPGIPGRLYSEVGTGTVKVSL